ncbi:hypothetical protein ACOMHN_041600 [Nucella lapillus]
METYIRLRYRKEPSSDVPFALTDSYSFPCGHYLTVTARVSFLLSWMDTADDVDLMDTAGKVDLMDLMDTAGKVDLMDTVD